MSLTLGQLEEQSIFQTLQFHNRGRKRTILSLARPFHTHISKDMLPSTDKPEAGKSEQRTKASSSTPPLFCPGWNLTGVTFTDPCAPASPPQFSVMGGPKRNHYLERRDKDKPQRQSPHQLRSRGPPYPQPHNCI